MKCLDTEKLIRYAYHLTDEPVAAEVRAHLGECPHCRGIVEQHARLDTVLDGWKVAEPTAGFDARVRQAVEAQQARREAWGFGGLGWIRGLALASLSVLVMVGAVWMVRGNHGKSNLTRAAVGQPQQPRGAQTSASAMKPLPPHVAAHSGERPAAAAPIPGAVHFVTNGDQEALALEDYDLAANFDLLSELPKGEQRVVN
jgi:anti-sigma factor RsiW